MFTCSIYNTYVCVCVCMCVCVYLFVYFCHINECSSYLDSNSYYYN